LRKCGKKKYVVSNQKKKKSNRGTKNAGEKKKKRNCLKERRTNHQGRNKRRGVGRWPDRLRIKEQKAPKSKRNWEKGATEKVSGGA